MTLSIQPTRVKSLFRNLSTVMVFNLVSYALRFGATILVARQWGPELYGQLALVMSIGSLVFIPLAMGQHSVMYKYLPVAKPQERSALMWTALQLNILATVGWLALLVLASSIIIEGLKITPILFGLALLLALSNNFQAISESFLRGQERFFAIGAARLTATLFLVIGIFGLLYLGQPTLNGLVVFFVLSAVLFSALALSNAQFKKITFDTAFGKTAMVFGSIVMVNQLVTALLFDGDILLLNRVLGEEDLGIYAAHLGILKQLFFIFFVEIFCVVFLPAIAKMDRKKLTHQLLKLLPLALPIVFLLAMSALVVVLTIFGAKFELRWPLVLTGALAITLFTLFQVMNHLLTMDGKRGAQLGFGAVVLCLPIFFYAIPYFAQAYGLIGALASMSGLYGILCVFTAVSLFLQFNTSDQR